MRVGTDIVVDEDMEWFVHPLERDLARLNAHVHIPVVPENMVINNAPTTADNPDAKDSM